MPKPVTPSLTVDIIIQLDDPDNHSILLIKRKNPPHGWALPGGFVDAGERLEQAAMREAKEETSLEVTLSTLLGCYSDPSRDPRSHTVSAVYIATARGTAQAADDATEVAWVDPANPQRELAFDHGLILQDYLRFRQTGALAPLRT